MGGNGMSRHDGHRASSQPAVRKSSAAGHSDGAENQLLAEARRRQPSPSGSGRAMSRQELAEAINAYLYRTARQQANVDETYIGELERGQHRWPSSRYRGALRTILGVSTDAELGFYPKRGGQRSADPPSDSAAELSQNQWRATRRELNRYRADMAKAAVALYSQGLRIPGTNLIASPDQVPIQPIDLDEIELEWASGPHARAIWGVEPDVRACLPLREPLRRFDRYTAAIRYLEPPMLFENRPSYRLLDASLNREGKPRLRFGLSTYFEKLDVCEAVGHEFATAWLSGSRDEDPPAWKDLPFRRSIGDPFDMTVRAINPAITTLTILTRRMGEASFLMHWRDASKVATAGGLYDVIPAGEFQPASIDPGSHADDLCLWRNIVREYSEELLGELEHDGSRGDPLEYEHWPLFRNIRRARAEGRIRGYLLAIGLDALTLAATIPTVVVIDADAFDEIFGAPVVANAEGRVVADRSGTGGLLGIPFTEEHVRRYLQDEPVASPGAACLALTWQHRRTLLASTAGR